MPLKTIQLCHMDRHAQHSQPEVKFTVTINADTGDQWAEFSCASEASARALRDAIRAHALNLRNVGNYRERKPKAAPCTRLTPHEIHTRLGAKCGSRENLILLDLDAKVRCAPDYPDCAVVESPRAGTALVYRVSDNSIVG